MSLCCSGKEQLKGKDFVETYNKINKPKKDKYGLYAPVGGECFDPRKCLNNVKSAQFPVPQTSKDFGRLTTGDLSNFSQRQIRKSNYE